MASGEGGESPGHAPCPVVADTNVLLRDVAKACRQERRTILVNVANTGAVRLFCARHVLDEFAAHAARYAARRGVPFDVYIRRWESEYLPFLRLVTPAEGLLDPAEAERVALLDHGPPARRDPDDVPSAVLALHLGAFYLSTDRKPLQAVHGPGVDLKRHGEWVAVLGSAGDASELGKLLRSASGISELAGHGGLATVKWVWNNVSPWAVAGIAAVAGYSLWAAEPEDRQRILRGASAVAGFVGEIAVEHQVASAAFTAMSAHVPAWAELARDVPAESVRARACLYTLARSPIPDLSAAELTDGLPVLPASTGETAVRTTLRRHDCFHQVHRGRWQVGRPAAEAWRTPIVEARPG